MNFHIQLINLHADLADYSELQIKLVKALARHSAEIGLPKQYAPNHLVLFPIRVEPGQSIIFNKSRVKSARLEVLPKI